MVLPHLCRKKWPGFDGEAQGLKHELVELVGH